MIACEAGKAHQHRINERFYAAFMHGEGLDIGYRGDVAHPEPVLPTATGVDKDFPGYDGRVLPFATESQDFVFASHSLEHITDYVGALREWFRVLKMGGNLVIAVPHQFLYEKKRTLPSLKNPDHKRFYTPASLCREIEEALEPNTYRIVHLKDRDDDYDYNNPPYSVRYSEERFEIECVIRKRPKPAWEMDP